MPDEAPGLVAQPGPFIYRTPLRSLSILWHRLPALARSGIFTLGATAAVQLINVYTGVVMAHLLAPAQRGAAAAFILWPALITMAGSLGIYESTVYSVSRSKGDERARLASASLCVSLALSMVLTIVTVFSIQPTMGRFPVASSAAFIYLPWVSLSTLTGAAMAALLADGRVGRFNSIRIAVVGLTAIGLTSLALAPHIHAEMKLPLVALVYVLANACTMIYAVGTLVATTPLRAPTLRDVRALTGFGLRLAPSNVASIVLDRGPLAAVALVAPAAEVGYFTVALTVASGVTLVNWSANSLVLPAATARIAGQGLTTRSTLRLMGASLGVTLASSFVIAIGTPYLIPFAFGSRFAPSVGPAEILVFAATVTSCGRTLASLMKASGHALLASASDAVAAAVLVALLVLTVRPLGTAAAAASSLVASAAGLVYAIAVFRRSGVIK